MAPAGAPRQHKQINAVGKAADCKAKAGAELAACNSEAQDQRIVQIGRDLWGGAGNSPAPYSKYN